MNKKFNLKVTHEKKLLKESAEVPAVKKLKNYVTPFGFNQLQNELRHLVNDERPKIVETIRWAAGNGDRSENSDYIYGKKRLREIDKRVRYLIKQTESAEIVDPRQQKNLHKIFFGALVTYQEEGGAEKTIKIVGVDEADINLGKVSWLSPLAKALMKAEVGDSVKLQTLQKTQTLTVLGINYVGD